MWYLYISFNYLYYIIYDIIKAQYMVELCSNFKTLEFKKKKFVFLTKTFFFLVAFLHYVFKIMVVGCYVRWFYPSVSTSWVQLNSPPIDHLTWLKMVSKTPQQMPIFGVQVVD